MAPANEKQQAHQLVEQLDAVVRLLQVMLDPLARTLANAPFDDEAVSEEEARQVAASRDSLARGEGIPHEEMLADFGLSNEDFEHMGGTPLDPHEAGQ